MDRCRSCCGHENSSHFVTCNYFAVRLLHSESRSFIACLPLQDTTPATACWGHVHSGAQRGCENERHSCDLLSAESPESHCHVWFLPSLLLFVALFLSVKVPSRICQEAIFKWPTFLKILRKMMMPLNFFAVQKKLLAGCNFFVS